MNSYAYYFGVNIVVSKCSLVYMLLLMFYMLLLMIEGVVVLMFVEINGDFN